MWRIFRTTANTNADSHEILCKSQDFFFRGLLGLHLEGKRVGQAADQEAEAVADDGTRAGVRHTLLLQHSVQVLRVHAADVNPRRGRQLPSKGGPRQPQRFLCVV